jgi:type IV pilus assembly protein PilM
VGKWIFELVYRLIVNLCDEVFMARGKIIGIDIGNYEVKVTVLDQGTVKLFFTEPVPDNAVKDGLIQYWDGMAEFLRETFKKHNIREKKAVFSVPMGAVYERRVEMPLMTVAQLKINLPYEFHDYITDEIANYYFDYAVLERKEKSMDLMAVACTRKMIEQYRRLAKAAGLKITGLVPEVFGYQRLLNHAHVLEAEKHPEQEKRDYAVLDLGEQAFRIHFFKKGIYEITRSMEPGCIGLLKEISDINGTDIHISRIAAESDQGNIMEHPQLMDLYNTRAVEVMRVLNFYSFNNPANTIDTLYCVGGGTKYAELMKAIARQVSLPVKLFPELLHIEEAETPEREALLMSPQSYGVAVEPIF